MVKLMEKIIGSYDKVLLTEDGKRNDGRSPDELRPLAMETGILERPDGSAIMEMGKTKAIAAAYGPSEVHPRHLARDDRAILRAFYRMVPFSVGERRAPKPSRREKEISRVVGNALQPVIHLDRYPGMGISVYGIILQADGGTRTAMLNASSLALADAGVPMFDLVASVATGVIGEIPVLDLNGIEDQGGNADIPIAYIPTRDEISLLQMDGRISSQVFDECLELALKGAKSIYKKQKKALKKKYERIRTEIED